MMEKSCGAIVYRIKNDKLEFLLVYQSNGHYSFPKGHMKDNETEIETALREIKEETNIDVKLDTNFREEITYFLESKNVMKKAVYFVGKPISFDLKNQEGEITECNWFDYETTIEKLGYDNIIEVFKEAYKYIKNN